MILIKKRSLLLETDPRMDIIMNNFKENLLKLVMGIGLSLLIVSNANAVPSFARQTGMNCVACHTSFPELTPFGREFKLNEKEHQLILDSLKKLHSVFD